MTILPGIGNGGSDKALETSFYVGQAPCGIAVVDFSGAGHVDLAVAYFGTLNGTRRIFHAVKPPPTSWPDAWNRGSRRPHATSSYRRA